MSYTSLQLFCCSSDENRIRHAIANTLISVVVFYLGLSILLQYSGTWYGSFLPINDASIYDNTGSRYNITRVVNSDMTLNEEAYKSYSPLFIR